MQKNQLRHSDIESLGQLRDELRVHAHLFKAEVKDEWKRIEADWRKLQSQLSPVKKATKKSASDVKIASKQLFRAVKKGYQNIRQSLAA